MPSVIYPAGMKILNTPMANREIPIISKISSMHFNNILPMFFNNFLNNLSPPCSKQFF